MTAVLQWWEEWGEWDDTIYQGSRLRGDTTDWFASYGFMAESSHPWREDNHIKWERRRKTVYDYRMHVKFSHRRSWNTRIIDDHLAGIHVDPMWMDYCQCCVWGCEER